MPDFEGLFINWMKRPYSFDFCIPMIKVLFLPRLDATGVLGYWGIGEISIHLGNLGQSYLYRGEGD